MTLRSYVDTAPLPDHVSGEIWDLDAARWRLDTLRSELPVAVARTAEFIGGASNDAWMFGDLVLRVCWRADRERMVREARLLEALPDTIPRAPVHGFGRTEELSWGLCGRVRGKPLNPELPTPVLRGLFDELAAILAALHAWTPPPEIAALMHDRPKLDLADPLSVWAADLVAMPIPRALAVSELVRALPHVDPTLVDAAVERIRSLAAADALEVPREPWVVVHGDAVIGNVLVHGARISALLDFEWARLGPPDLELASLVRMAQGLPFPMLDWLQEDYPRLFAAPDLDQRLWLYELGYMLRGVIWWPPDRPEFELTPKHLIHTLRTLVDAPMPRA